MQNAIWTEVLQVTIPPEAVKFNIALGDSKNSVSLILFQT